jgi:hypothetical protein
LIGGIDAGLRQPVEEGRFARIGVAHQGHGGDMGLLAGFAPLAPLIAHLVEALVELLDATAQETPVRL